MKSETATIASPRHAGMLPPVLAAFAANFRFFPDRRPRTPLRVLSLIAIDAALRSRGSKLRPSRRRAVVEAMELGAMLNDRFDGDAFDSEALAASVSWFADSTDREVVWSYAKRLRRLERSRPGMGEPGAAVQRYRERVNQVSLAVLWALANSKSLAHAESEFEREPDLRMLFQIVMLIQMIDDVLDVRQDRRMSLPSFATAAGANAESLQALTNVYAIPGGENSCLRVALGIVAGLARTAISIRAVLGFA